MGNVSLMSGDMCGTKLASNAPTSVARYTHCPPLLTRRHVAAVDGVGDNIHVRSREADVSLRSGGRFVFAVGYARHLKSSCVRILFQSPAAACNAARVKLCAAVHPNAERVFLAGR